MNSAIDARTIEVLEKATNEESPNEFKTSVGVTLRLKPVSLFLLKDIGESFKEPSVPFMYDEERGRNIYNDNDPDFIRAVEQHEQDFNNAVLDTMIGLGTEPMYPLPKDVPQIEDSEWSERINVYHPKQIPDSGPARYLAWLKYIALMDTDDISNLGIAIKGASNFPEKSEVAAAIATFPDNAARAEDNQNTDK